MFAGRRLQESGHMGNGKTNQQELWYQPTMMQDDVGMGQHGDPMSNWHKLTICCEGNYSPFWGALGLDSQIWAPDCWGEWFYRTREKHRPNTYKHHRTRSKFCVIDFITIQKTMVSGECWSILGGWDCQSFCCHRMLHIPSIPKLYQYPIAYMMILHELQTPFVGPKLLNPRLETAAFASWLCRLGWQLCRGRQLLGISDFSGFPGSW